MSGETVKGSWRTAYGYRFLSSEDLEDDQTIKLKIKGVSKQKAYNAKSKSEVELLSVSFENTDKFLALNATNARSIADIAGSPMVEKWQGVVICLYREPGKWFGEDQFALRIKTAE